MKKRVYTFRCPECRKFFRAEEPGEPCCTGPSEMRDDHPMEVMRLVSVDDVEVHPDYAEARVVGPLKMPVELERPTPIIILP